MLFFRRGGSHCERFSSITFTSYAASLFSLSDPFIPFRFTRSSFVIPSFNALSHPRCVPSASATQKPVEITSSIRTAIRHAISSPSSTEASVA